MEIFTKGTKRGRWRRRSAHPAAATTGVSVTGGRGGGPQGGSIWPRRGASPLQGGKSETAPPGKALGATEPLLGSPPKQSPWYPGELGWRRRDQGPPSDQGPKKIKKGSFPDRAVPGSVRSCHLRRGAEGGVMGGADRPLQNPSRVRGPPRRVLHPAQARPQRTRGAILLFRPPPEIWRCAPGRAGCRGGRGPLTLSGGGNCS